MWHTPAEGIQLTSLHTESRTKIANITNPLRVNIWKIYQNNHFALQTKIEHKIAPKYCIIYYSCASNCAIVFMSQIDTLKSDTFSMKNWTEFYFFAVSSLNCLCYLFERPVSSSITWIIYKFNHLITVWGQRKNILKYPFAWTDPYAGISFICHIFPIQRNLTVSVLSISIWILNKVYYHILQDHIFRWIAKYTHYVNNIMNKSNISI